MAREATPEEREVIRSGLSSGQSNATISRRLAAIGKGAASSAGEDAGLEAAGGGPEDPAADAAAVANTARKAAAASKAASATRPKSSAAQTARTVYQRVPAPSSSLYPSSSSPAVGGASKVIWAVAVFVLVMEGLSYLTGQYFTWNLGKQPLTNAKTQSYVPLYTASGAPTQAPAGVLE